MFGRLAQLVERFIDVEEVTGSNPVSPTKSKFQSDSFGALNFARRYRI